MTAPRGRHAVPARLRTRGLSVARPRHGRLVPGPLTATLIGVTAVGLAMLSVQPAPGEAGGRAVAQAASLPSPIALTVRLGASLPDEPRLTEERASRARASRARVVSARASATAPAVVSSPEPLLPGCVGRESADYANGQLPSSALCELPGGVDERLRPAAARSFVALSAAYAQALGRPPCVIDGYRTLGEQQQLRRTRPRFAARPGSSEHGLGLAVDLGCGMLSSRSAETAWMRSNAARFGWVHPVWARPGGSRPEPWHWEYVAAS